MCQKTHTKSLYGNFYKIATNSRNNLTRGWEKPYAIQFPKDKTAAILMYQKNNSSTSSFYLRIAAPFSLLTEQSTSQVKAK